MHLPITIWVFTGYHVNINRLPYEHLPVTMWAFTGYQMSIYRLPYERLPVRMKRSLISNDAMNPILNDSGSSALLGLGPRPLFVWKTMLKYSLVE